MPQSILILKCFDSKAKYPWEKLAIVDKDSIYTSLITKLNETSVSSQMAAFYPDRRSAHYQGNRNFLAVSLGLYYLLLCYSSGSVIHNVE